MLAALVALLLAVAITPAWGQQPQLDAEELGIEVEVGFGGQAVRGRWMPVTVTLAPSRLFAGDLGVVAQTNYGQTVETRPVEVAAGSTKVFRFLVPPAHDVTVQAAEQGRSEGITVRPRLQYADTFLVGVLGDTLPRDLPPLTSYPLDQRGTYVPVDPAFLDRSSRALDQLSGLVATSRDLAALSEESRTRLASAVSLGTDLVVTPDQDGRLDLGLPWTAATSATTVQGEGPDGATQAVRVLELGPTAWGMTAADLGWGEDTRPIVAATNAGKGRLIVTGVAPGDGGAGSSGAFWSRLLQPNLPTATSVESGGLERAIQSAGEGLRSDTVSLPPIPVLVAFLLAYLLLIGPVNGLVLARLGKRELAWVTIPVMTLVFSIGAFLTASGTEASAGLSGRAAYWVDGQGTQIQSAAVRAPRVGEHELRFEGADWDIAPATWSNAPAIVDRHEGDTVTRMRLEALQVGTVTAMRDVTTPAPLAVDIDPTPEGAKVTVTNLTAVPVDDVRVRAGTLSDRVGTLAPGATATVELSRDTLPVSRDWHDDFAGLRQPDGTVIAPRSLEALLRWSILDGNPGIVWATGTVADDLDLGVPAADGVRSDDRGTFLAVGLTAGLPGTLTLPWEVDRKLLTVGFGEAWRPGPLAIEGRVEAVLRFRLPNEGPTAQLVSSLDRGQLDGQLGGDIGVGTQTVCEDGPNGGECFEVDPRTGERIVPPAPECPPDATSCSFDGKVFEVCFEDQNGGVCEATEVAQPDFPGVGGVPASAEGLEVYDHGLERWIAVGDAFGGAATDDLLSPLGEVYVRVVGELHPFDFSGRGIAAERGAA